MRVILALLVVAALAAADVGPPPPPHRVYAAADVVFVCRVEVVAERTATVRVEEVLKGEPGKVVTVGPITGLQCFPDVGDPIIAVGERLIVAARRAGDRYRFIDESLDWARLSDETLGVAKEMVRVAAMEEAKRCAAMIDLLRSPNLLTARAAALYQDAELRTPELSAPHVAGLVKALGAPHAEGRIAAMRALKGLVPEEAAAPLIALSRSDREDEAVAACAALAPYDRQDTFKALLAACDGPHRGKAVAHLDACPSPEAHAWLREAIGGRPGTRAAVFDTLARRFRKFGVDGGDMEALLWALRGGIAGDEGPALARALLNSCSDLLAPALVVLLGEKSSTLLQREVACDVLRHRIDDGKTAEAVRGAERVLVACLDKGDRGAVTFLVDWLHTPACRSALERAVAGKDPGGAIKAALREWDRR